MSRGILIGELDFELDPSVPETSVQGELHYELDGTIQVRLQQRGTDRYKVYTFAGTLLQRDSQGSEETVDSAAAAGDFLLRETRRLCARLPAGGLRTKLLAAAGACASALETQATDPGRVDRLEDDLLELLEEAEGSQDPAAGD